MVATAGVPVDEAAALVWSPCVAFGGGVRLPIQRSLKPCAALSRAGPFLSGTKEKREVGHVRVGLGWVGLDCSDWAVTGSDMLLSSEQEGPTHLSLSFCDRSMLNRQT
jgi:hypothetical protein